MAYPAFSSSQGSAFSKPLRLSEASDKRRYQNLQIITSPSIISCLTIWYSVLTIDNYLLITFCVN
jgi:hypothetical protein